MRKKRSAVTAVLFILTLLSAAAILFFSSQTAEESSARSRGVTAWLVRMLCGGFDSLSGEERDALIARWHPYVRKAAHVTEFAGFAFFLTLLLKRFKGLRRAPLWALGAGAVLAACDEAKQLLAEGRSPALRDVGIDCAGVLLGMSAAMLIGLLIRKCRRRPREEECTPAAEGERGFLHLKY